MPDAAQAYYDAQKELILATLGLLRTAWRGMGSDFDASWRVVGPRVRLIALSAQLGAARAAEPYMADVLSELDIDADAVGQVAPGGFVGIAGDGRPVDSLLLGSVVTSKRAVVTGSAAGAALDEGERWLDMAVHTLVSDTARAAVTTAMIARPAVTGWVRMLQLPSCGRCAILAGAYYRWSSGFARHPRCDCRHIPATENIARSLITDPRASFDAGQVRGLTGAQTKALNEGADMAQVVNSRRGMDSARSLTTREATGRGQRLTPEGIYARAGDDRDEALRLLRQHGYLT